MASVEAALERTLEVLSHRPAALISDIDGTLSRIVPDPADAVVSESIRGSLRRLLPLVDLLGVVTGRDSDLARRMVGVEGLEYVGSYALGAGATPDANASQVALVREAVLPYLGRMPCVQLEDKDVSFALHYRNCADPAETRARLLSLVEPLVAGRGARIVEGKQVIEVVPRELPDKGAALARLLDAHAVNGAVFLGDDLGDTAAFREVRRRRRDGHPGLAIAVVDAETPPEVRAAADVAIEGVDAVELILEQLAARLETQPQRGT